MTCEEYMAALRTDPRSHTRAFRAVVQAHAEKCGPCGRIMDQLMAAALEGILNGSVDSEAIKFAQDDVRDPEYREVAFGEKPNDTR